MLGWFFDMFSMGVITTKLWQTSGWLEQELNVCTVHANQRSLSGLHFTQRVDNPRLARPLKLNTAFIIHSLTQCGLVRSGNKGLMKINPMCSNPKRPALMAEWSKALPLTAAYLSIFVQVNLDMTDSMGPGKLVSHMQNPSYTYDEHLICIGLGPNISSVICKDLSYSGPSYPSSPVYIKKNVIDRSCESRVVNLTK